MREEIPLCGPAECGKEKVKGFSAIGDANKLLRRKCPEYIGYMEGNEVLSGRADVVVCDGFAGNALLKTCETFHSLIASVIERKQPDLLGEIRQYLSVLDPENYGAVPFLGIKGIVLKAHGGSSPKAIASAVAAALQAVRRNVVDRLFS